MLADVCASVAVPEPSELALQYYRSGNILWILQQLWGFAVPLLFLAWGFTGKLGRFSEEWGRNWYFTIVVYLVFYILISQVLSFPIEFYGKYLRQHAYGLSTQTFGRWFGNYGKETLVSILGCAAFIWVFYLLLKKSPKRWWFYSSIASVVIMFLMDFVQPVLVDPLFHKYGPLQNKQLEEKILALATKAGIDHGRVYEVNMSQDTKMLNAYVNGFGDTKRIVLWDTTLEKMNDREILFVMGHEMGHYVLHHMWWGLGFGAASSFIVFYLTYWISGALLSRFHERFGFSELSNIASFPLLILVISALMFVLTPLSNLFSRHLEHEADRFGLEITKDNQAAGESFLILQQQNLGNPRPGLFYKIWRATHPPIGERIDFFNSYCPWHEDKPLKYGYLFKSS
jgi:STE24 endopeptidase